MLYRENGQFKSSYRADQQIFPIVQDRWVFAALLAVAFVAVPLLAPETDYETTIGFRTNVVFPTAALRMDDNIIRIYYGAADTVIAFAEAREEDLIQLCLKGE